MILKKRATVRLKNTVAQSILLFMRKFFCWLLIFAKGCQSEVPYPQEVHYLSQESALGIYSYTLEYQDMNPSSLHNKQRN